MNEDWSYRRNFTKVPDALIALLSPRPPLLTVFVTLLQRARYSGAGPKFTAHGIVDLDIGEAVFGRSELAEACGTSEQSIRTAIDQLVKLEILTIRATKRGSIATLCRFKESYPFVEGEQPTEQPSSNHAPTMLQPSSNHAPTTNEDLRERDRKKVDGRERSVPRPNLPVNASALRIAEKLRDLLQRNTPAGKIKKQSDVIAWARDLELLHSEDGVAYEDIERVVEWTHTSDDPYWRPTIRSGRKVREKFDVLLGQMQRPANGKRGTPSHERDYDNSAGLYTGAEEQAS